MTRPKSSASVRSDWTFWLRFYVLLFVLFLEVLAFTFQNIEKKRMGHELAYFVYYKKQLLEAREKQNTEVLLTENLDQTASVVQSFQPDLALRPWPVYPLVETESYLSGGLNQ